MRYSHTLLVTETAERRHGERPSGGPYYSLREMPPHYQIASIRRKLAGIIAKLGPLSEQNGIMRFFKNADHANILNGFVQDLAYAVTDYQVWEADSIPGVF